MLPRTPARNKLQLRGETAGGVRQRPGTLHYIPNISVRDMLVQREGQEDLDGLAVETNLAPRYCLVRTRPAVAPIEFLSEAGQRRPGVKTQRQRIASRDPTWHRE
jgi:hypothetical protein